MQTKNQTWDDFFSRTDALADALGCDVQDLAPKIGISRATLFACRGRKAKVSEKTWDKLESAERKALEDLRRGRGYLPEREERAEPPPSVNEDARPAETLEERVERLDAEVRQLRSILRAIRDALLSGGRDYR